MPRGWPRSSASRASSCRPTPASARRSASWRAPVAYELVRTATCGSTPSTPRPPTRSSRRCSARRRRWSCRGGARPATCRAPPGLHALCRPGPRDHGRAARPAARRRPMPKRCAQAFERDYAALFERLIPNAAIEILSWAVPVSTEAKLPAPQGAGAAPRRARAGRRAAGVRRPQRPRDRRAGLPPRVACRRAAPSAGRPSSSRTRPRPTSRPVLPRTSMPSGCIVMDRKDA